MLAYSGGLDTSVILRWLRGTITGARWSCSAPCRAGRRDTGLSRPRRSTASKLNFREEFARDFVFLMMRANAVYEGYYLLGTSIARPVIAKGQVAAALAEGCSRRHRGGTMLELAYARLAPELKVVGGPDWPFKGRADMLAYAAEKIVPMRKP